ncbi:MAG: hydroxymethylglutaryl-CoA lyase [Pseudobdellovibrio sp.]|jgi:hydroxymethylglutaryl-CoA lyase|nr:hydroxymethylglutaryl-CoA lyase [Pseudobdellovibrio sp.]
MLGMKGVKIVEVGLRDGLQNETTNLSVEQRYDLFERLSDAGIKNIEIGAFVSPKWVPQMAVSSELASMIVPDLKKSKSKVNVSTLVPNLEGMLQALEADIPEIAIFAACSESFSKKNINCTIDESFKRFEPVMKLAKEHKVRVRGYLSTCFGCPFEGKVSEAKVVAIAKRMYKMGVYEISIGDTIGVATPGQVESLFKKLKKALPVAKLAGHFHDTRGTALANILAAYNVGVRTFDSSIGGLGGCPYAPGAAGNVATEDVVYLFDGMKVKTGVDLNKLLATNAWLQPQMDHALPSKVGRVGKAKPIGKV